jgi:putrescine aminotransferase
MVHPDDFHHGFTFSGHPRGVRRRSENLEIIEQKKLVPGVKEFTGPAVAKMLAKLKYPPLVGEVRSIGLLGAIETSPTNERAAASPLWAASASFAATTSSATV